jgi:hypothetical protein
LATGTDLVLLQEVGVALGQGDDAVGGGAFVGDAFRSGGQLERVACCLFAQPVDGGEAKEALGVRLGRAGECRQLRQTGAGEGQRQLALRYLVQRGDERLQFGTVEELHFVEQEDDAGLVLGRRLAERDEEIGEVAEVAGIRPAKHRLDVDAHLQPLRCAQRVRFWSLGLGQHALADRILARRVKGRVGQQAHAAHLEDRRRPAEVLNAHS